MPDPTFLRWPFFDDAHRTLAAELDAWAGVQLTSHDPGADVDARCRDLVRRLGDAGWLRYAMPAGVTRPRTAQRSTAA